MSTDIQTDNKGDKPIPDRWTAKLSLSHWLAIAAIPVGIMSALYLLWQEKPLTARQLGVQVNPTCLTDTIAVSLPATPAMTFGGTLKAGDTLSIASPASKASTPILFPNLLVLDVKAVPQANPPASVIVLALPKTSAAEFATHLADPTMLISRDLSGKEKSCLIQNH